MQHIIILLVNSQVSLSHINDIEKVLQEFSFDPVVKLYYLLMTLNDKTEFKDFMYEVEAIAQANEKKNNLLLKRDNLNLGNSEGLSDCFNIIKESNGKAKYYFISAGEGLGLGLKRCLYQLKGKLDIDLEPKLFNFPVIDTSHLSKEQNESDKIIWNFELKKSFETLWPDLELVIFFNCNTNLFDSLYFYSEVTNYLIGSENNMVMEMFKLKEILSSIQETLNIQQTRKNKLLKVFRGNTTGFKIGQQVCFNENTTLFLVKLTAMPLILKNFKNLVEVLTRDYSDNYLWFNDLIFQVEKEDNYLTSSDFVDMVVLLKKIDEILKSPRKLKFKIKSMCSKIENELIMSKMPIKKNNSAHGVSIYLPRVRSNKIEFNRYMDLYMKENNLNLINFPWYQFLKRFIMDNKKHNSRASQALEGS